MLSIDKIAFVVRDGALIPRYLTERDEPWIRALLSDVDAFTGRTVGERELSLPDRVRELAFTHGVAPRIVMAVAHALGAFWKGRIASRRSPAEVRRAVYEARARAPSAPRETILAEAAALLEVSPDEVEAWLFADLPAARRIVAPEEAPGPARVRELYNLRAVQGILMRAEMSTVAIREHVRSVVRWAKLQRLLCTYARDEGATLVSVSGPLSVLRQTTKYGRAFAAFLPAVISTPGWRLSADCTVNTRRVRFTATSADPIGCTFALPRASDSAVERALVRDLRRARTSWTIERETEAIVLDRGGVFFPDFTLRRGTERVLVEIVGFYTAEYLEKKLASLRAVRTWPIVVAIDEALACSDDVIAATQVLRYRKRVDVAALLAAADAAARSDLAGRS